MFCRKTCIQQILSPHMYLHQGLQSMVCMLPNHHHALNLLFCRLFMKAILKKSCCVVGNYQSLKFIFLVQQRSLPLTFLHLANIRILEFTLIELVIYWDLHYNHHHHQLIPHFKCKIFQYRQNQNSYPNLSYGQLSAKLPVNLCYHFQYWISDNRTDTQTTLTPTGLLCREKIFHVWRIQI